MDQRIAVPSRGCIVYSFGVVGEWSFEEQMESFGCRVYAFDHKLQELGDHQHSPNVKFHLMSLSDRDVDIVVEGKYNNRKIRLKTLSSIYQMLSTEHGNRTIDFLKIESHFDNEIEIIENLLKSGILHRVRQMEMLVRFKVADSTQQHRPKTATIKLLENYGFVRFSSVTRGSRILLSAFEFPGFGDWQLSWLNRRLIRHS